MALEMGGRPVACSACLTLMPPEVVAKVAGTGLIRGALSRGAPESLKVCLKILTSARTGTRNPVWARLSIFLRHETIGRSDEDDYDRDNQQR